MPALDHFNKRFDNTGIRWGKSQRALATTEQCFNVRLVFRMPHGIAHLSEDRFLRFNFPGKLPDSLLQGLDLLKNL